MNRDVPADIDQIIDNLLWLRANWPTAHTNMREWRRGGLPTTSIATGPPSGEPPLPLPDQLDRRIDHDRNDLGRWLPTLIADSRAWRARISWWTATADVLPDPTPQPCTAPHCAHVCDQIGNDRARTSPLDSKPVCPACWQHERRHGTRRKI